VRRSHMFLSTYFALIPVIALFLIDYDRVTAMSMLEPRLQIPEEEVPASSEITLSLWLLPPLADSRELQHHIHRLSQGGTKGPVFQPHITLVGGIKCRSEVHVQEVARTLKEGLAGFGRIPCQLSPKAYSAEKYWSQALYLIIEPSAALLNLCQRARAMLGMDTENWTFPLPSSYPHISIFYGTKNIPDKADVPTVSSFHASRVALWRTDPSSLEGVTSWSEVTAFDIN